MMLYLRIINLFRSKIFTLFFSKSFNSFGKGSRIIAPLNIQGIERINIGAKVYIGYKGYLAAVPLTGSKQCSLMIGDGTSIGNFNHIFATTNILIGKNVLTADKVYISDNQHGYEDVGLSIKDQPVIQLKEVAIGDSTWIGENVCIIGATIGKHCVIGANSVVTKDIPDYSVAVGAPAKVIKRYNPLTKIWEKNDHQ